MADKFIVIDNWTYKETEWRVVPESKAGVDFETAERIRNYVIEVKGRSACRIRIVRLKDDFAEDIGNGQA